MGHNTSAEAFREQLMAPHAIERVHALHALESLTASVQGQPLAQELEAFTARGIPYYAPQEPAYREWVNTAVGYWERLHAPKAKPARRASRKAEPVA
jgi:hypothetical protein